MHGDLRKVNTYATKDTQHGIAIIDFDWAGKIDQATYPMWMNPELCCRKLLLLDK